MAPSSAASLPPPLQSKIRRALDKSAVTANKSAVPSATVTLAQAAELAGLLAAEPPAGAPPSAESAVFAPVTSGSAQSTARLSVPFPSPPVVAAADQNRQDRRCRNAKLRSEASDMSSDPLMQP